MVFLTCFSNALFSPAYTIVAERNSSRATKKILANICRCSNWVLILKLKVSLRWRLILIHISGATSDLTCFKRYMCFLVFSLSLSRDDLVSQGTENLTESNTVSCVNKKFDAFIVAKYIQDYIQSTPSDLFCQSTNINHLAKQFHCRHLTLTLSLQISKR